MTGERLSVSRVALSQFTGGGDLPSVHVCFEPDPDVPEAVLIHVRAHQLDGPEAVAGMLSAIADTLLAKGMLAGELGTVQAPPTTHTPFNPQPMTREDAR